MHIITSIPAEQYRALPEPEPGQTPGGTWLLFAYLKFAEGLKQARDSAQALADEVNQANAETNTAADPASPKPQPAKCTFLPTKRPSAFAEAFANRLAADHGVASDVHWGNEGFCVDLALRDPKNPREVTIGVLCDAARCTAAADDPMQWDIFHTAILESQGWKPHRLWTPHFFRDPKGAMRKVASEAGGGQ